MSTLSSFYPCPAPLLAERVRSGPSVPTTTQNSSSYHQRRTRTGGAVGTGPCPRETSVLGPQDPVCSYLGLCTQNITGRQSAGVSGAATAPQNTASDRHTENCFCFEAEARLLPRIIRAKNSPDDACQDPGSREAEGKPAPVQQAAFRGAGPWVWPTACCPPQACGINNLVSPPSIPRLCESVASLFNTLNRLLLLTRSILSILWRLE